MTKRQVRIPNRFWSYRNLFAWKEERRPVFDIPDIREYFLDLEYVLGVIADGPTKSFAFRRLKYLLGNFTMYSLVNEFQELADLKVGVRCYIATWFLNLADTESPASVLCHFFSSISRL